MARITSLLKTKLDLSQRNLLLISTNCETTSEQSRIINLLKYSHDIDVVTLIKKSRLMSREDEEFFNKKRAEFLHQAYNHPDSCTIFFMLENKARKEKKLNLNFVTENANIFKDSIHVHRSLKSKLSVYMNNNYHSRNAYLHNETIKESIPFIGFHADIEIAVAHVNSLASLKKDEYEKRFEEHYSPAYVSLHRHPQSV